jgi:hypothetical protein
VLPPPKQRGTPDESTLHTAFFPSQQFCEALMFVVPPSGSVPAPQMLPTPLQAEPLSHRPPAQFTEPLGFTPPPQQSLAPVQ